MNTKDLFKFPYSIYCFTILFYSGFIMAIYTLFFLSKGLSMTQIALLESVWAITDLIFNVPSGILSDKIGHKLTTALSITLQAIVMILLALINGFPWFLFLFGLWGISSAMSEGPVEALVYENAMVIGQEYKVIRSKLEIFSSLTMIFDTTLGPILFRINPGLPWIATAISTSLSMIFLIYIPESSKSEREFSMTNLGRTIKTPGIVWACLYFGILTSIGLCFIDLIEQPLLLFIGVPLIFLGMVIALSRIFPGVVLYFQDKHRFLDHEDLIYGLGPFVWIMALCSFAVFGTLFVLPMYFLFIAFREFNGVLYDNHIQTRIKDDVRASAYSFVEMIISLIYVIMSVAIGHIIDVYGFVFGILGLMIFSVVLLVLAFLNVLNKI